MEKGIYWDTSASRQVSNCDGVVLEIYVAHRFQWPQEGLNCESAKLLLGPLGHKATRPLGNYFVCKRFAVRTLLWSLEFVIQINLEHDTIAKGNIVLRNRQWEIKKPLEFFRAKMLLSKLFADAWQNFLAKKRI